MKTVIHQTQRAHGSGGILIGRTHSDDIAGDDSRGVTLPCDIGAEVFAENRRLRSRLDGQALCDGNLSTRTPIADGRLKGADLLGKTGYVSGGLDGSIECVHAASITKRVIDVNTHRVRHASQSVNNERMSFASNLRRFRLAAGLTQEALADKCGFPTQSRIANYERGQREPSIEDQITIAQALEVSQDALVGNSADEYDPEWPFVNAFAQAVGLGDGKEAADYEETHKLKFRAASLRRKGLNPSKLCVVYGSGESMTNRIRSGDAIMYDTSDTRPTDDAVFVIRRGAEYSAKRCEITDDGLIYFKADNPKGDHRWNKAVRMDNPKNPIEILGRVRWIGSWED